MASNQVLDGKFSEECTGVSLAANQSEDKSILANSSFENSPLLDKEKFLRYSARSRDEFWDALSSNYDYLMDDGLIATCREASSDLSLDDENEIPESCFWSFTQFIEHFKWLHDLLHNIQVAKEGENTPGSKILEDQHKVAYLCKLFNDQAQRLSKRYPDMRDEVHRHLNRLNNKWKAVEQSINPNKVKSPLKDGVFNEIAINMRNLRKWLREMENRLIPVNLAMNWTLECLEMRYKEQQDIQREIEGKGKYLSALVKLCKHLKGNVQFGQKPLMLWDADQVRKVASNLEHKWHTLWLKSLECLCSLENLIQSYASDSDLEKSFTEEPLKKYPRLSGTCEELLLFENELKNEIGYQMEDRLLEEDLFSDHIQQTDILCCKDECLKNDKGVMVGDTGIAELKAECQRGSGKFEIIQDVGYSSETSAHLSNDEKLDSPEAHLTRSLESSIETVIPVVQEESGVVQSDRGGSTEPSPGVRMRKKKRSNRDRPWSVTDVHQSFNTSIFPHSTSESALDLLYSIQDSKKNGSKKVSTDGKRLSLTDFPTFSSQSNKSFKINKNIPKSLNCKLNFPSEKPPARKKKGAVSDKGSDKYDSSCSTTQGISLSKDTSDLLKSTPSSATSLVSVNEKSGLVTNVEDHGSISDQAWDEYQDPPYLSEPYSEQTADEDEVKKLINFGDDYRNMLGSYSDASSISLKTPLPKFHKSRSKSSWRKGSSQESRDSLMSDSNSDSEDFHNILKTSTHALHFVSNALKENTQKMSLFSSEFAELVATCETNLCHLRAIRDELVAGCEIESLSEEDILQLQDLIKEWEALQVRLLTFSRNDSEQKPKNTDLEGATIDVYCSLATLKEKLSSIAACVEAAGASTTSLSELKLNIQTLQTRLSDLQEINHSFLYESARIRRLVAEGGGPSIAQLKESATKLYQQWEDVYELNCSQLTKLQALQSCWHESKESEMNNSSETTVQWHPVQVGNSLPTPQISTEELFQNTAAEVQIADQHDVLFEIETECEQETIECVIENEDFADSIRLLSPPALNTKSLGPEMLREKPEVGNLASNSKKASCFWRALKATLPIQFVLVILYCMSCLMEPQSCENMNNYKFSLYPHLRYPRGPPPA